MYLKVIFICLQALVVKQALSLAINGCNSFRSPASVIQGNAVTTVTALPTLNNQLGCSGPVQSSQVAPLVTEIVPSLQLGDITVGGDIPIGGSIKVTGPVQSSQVAPFVTEIVPSLQLGNITVGGDIPIGGCTIVTGCFPVYGLVSVDGAVPSTGTALINAGGGVLAQVVDAPCRAF